MLLGLVLSLKSQRAENQLSEPPLTLKCVEASGELKSQSQRDKNQCGGGESLESLGRMGQSTGVKGRELLGTEDSLKLEDPAGQHGCTQRLSSRDTKT